MKAIPKRTFLLRTEEVSGQRRKKDVVAKKGEAVDVTDQEAKLFADSLILPKRK